MAEYTRVPLVFWLCMTVLVEYRSKFGLLVTAQSSLPKLCHGDHGRCINDTTFQNCSDGRNVPRILKDELRNTSAVVNTTATFKCKQSNVIASFIGLQFDWIKWNKIAATHTNLDVDNGDFSDMQTNPKHQQESDVEGALHVSYLVIYNVNEDDVGLYTCVVCNEYGRDYSSAFLTLAQDNTSIATVESISSTQITPSTSFFSSTSGSQLSKRAKTLLGVVGAILCLAIIAGMLFVIRQKKGFRFRGMPRFLFQPNSPEQEHDTAALSSNQQSDHLTKNQRTSLIPLIRNRNSSYRSQLSSAASSGTVLTYADDLFECPLDENWEVERQSIVIKELLGEGAFGYVMKAEAYELPLNAPVPCTVAVKMLKENATDAELSDLISEMQTMKDIGTHNNIVNFLGACTVQGPLLLVVEYCANGNLRDFLRNHRPSQIDLANDPVPQLKIKDLLSFAYQITKGMSYLSSKKCIHRDLAARNVLISEDFVVKIADFGLSRNLGNTDYYRKTTHGRLPVKWLPIEALFDQQYTVKSDVWSFGIILWEIFTLGGTPYPGIPVERLFTLLKNGYRMESPINCLPNIYEMMLQCWSENAESRPSFSQLTSHLDDMLSSETRKDYVEVLAQSVDCLIQAGVEDTDDTNSHNK